MSKLVLVTTSREKSRGGYIYRVREAYVKALTMHNVTPVFVPSSVSEEGLLSIYKQADGVLLTGGGDMAPAAYGGMLTPAEQKRVYSVDTERDNAEMFLARQASADDKPLLAICRGHQVVNVALGGTLIVDIPLVIGTTVIHKKPDARRELLHTVDIEKDSRLYTIVKPIMNGSDVLPVNSIHHQAVNKIGTGLKVTAHAPDGVIEATEDPKARFYLTVQWHPEELVGDNVAMQALFRAFAESL